VSTGAHRVSSFGGRLAAAMDDLGPLCVGIDPHPALLAAWGLADDVAGLRRFSLTVVEALAGRVAALKPQSAFFERHGAAGVGVLEEVLAAACADGRTQVILDAKRGDIGSTMAGYADAYLRAGAPLACDALTVSPYLGVGSLEPAVRAARDSGRGLFVLALTSNPEGAAVQHAMAQGPDGPEAVAAAVARQVRDLNTAELAASGTAPLGSVGLVVGATVGDAVHRLGIDLAAVRGPLLAPGIGAQGAGPAELREVFGSARRAVLAATSRAVLGAGPDGSAVRAAASRATTEAAAALR